MCMMKRAGGFEPSGAVECAHLKRASDESALSLSPHMRASHTLGSSPRVEGSCAVCLEDHTVCEMAAESISVLESVEEELTLKLQQPGRSLHLRLQMAHMLEEVRRLSSILPEGGTGWPWFWRTDELERSGPSTTSSSHMHSVLLG